MIKLYYLLTALIFITATVQAQKRQVSGVLLDSITHFPIYDGTITNGSANKIVHTDSSGRFRIEAAPNNFIYVFAQSYRRDTLTYSFLFSDTLTIYLATEGNILPGVLVTTKYTKYQVDSIKRKTDFEQLRGQRIPVISSNNSAGFGIGINLDRIYKQKYKNQKKSTLGFEAREERLYIDYRFSAYVVAYYTGYKGETLRSFMTRYTPSYKWLRQHTENEDLLYYINDKLKLFKAVNSN